MAAAEVPTPHPTERSTKQVLTFPGSWIALAFARSHDQLLQVNLICVNEERDAAGH